MVTGTSLQASKDALRLTRLYPSVLYATAGKKKKEQKVSLFHIFQVVYAQTWVGADVLFFLLLEKVKKSGVPQKHVLSSLTFIFAGLLLFFRHSPPRRQILGRRH